MQPKAAISYYIGEDVYKTVKEMKNWMMKSILFRMRKKLKKYFEKEGVIL